ncbi:ECF transporter S component [Blautia producta]|uniref:ECF transporter S component n=1 Tax=Blautia producta TaxID=33035 RepID=UPI0036F2B2B9
MSNEAIVNKRPAGAQNRSKIRTLAQVAMLGAVATVLMMIEFPIPVIAPPFYQMDFSEVPVLVGAFAMGPAAGIMIELLKVLLYAVIHGSATAGVGEIANFLIGCSFIVPAAFFYKYRRNKTYAVIGMAIGTITMAVVGCVVNAFILLPAYGAAFGMPVSAFIQMGTSIHPAINNLFTFVVLAVAPFNLVKGCIISAATLLIYKRIRVLLRGE